MIGGLLRLLVERGAGYAVERYGTSYALVNPARRREAWFSYQSALITLFADMGVTMVIDVGANTGQFASEARTFFKGAIHSFEPVAATYLALASRAAGDPQWSTYQFALGSETETKQMHLSASSDFSSLLVSNEYCVERFGKDAQHSATESVSIKRLEDVLPTLTPTPGRERIFLKMDTQGYDLEVFRGAGDALRHVVAIQSEVSLVPIYEGMPHWTQSISHFEQCGFGVAGLFPVSTDSGRVVEYDCLLTRARPANAG